MIEEASKEIGRTTVKVIKSKLNNQKRKYKLCDIDMVCLRCDHKWKKRIYHPKRCPRCGASRKYIRNILV